MAPRRKDPLFEAIRKQIETARDKLREHYERTGSQAERDRIHQKFKKLFNAHKRLGFAKLDNIKAAAKKKLDNIKSGGHGGRKKKKNAR